MPITVDAAPNVRLHEFIDTELIPAIRVDGPVSSFVLEAARKEMIKEQAVETGTLAGVSSADYPAYSDERQRRARSQAKRGLEVFRIMSTASEDHVASAEDQLAMALADYGVWQAVVVEASSRIAEPRRQSDIQQRGLYRGLLQEGLAALYETPSADLAMQCLGQYVPLVSRVAEHPAAVMRTFASSFTEEYPFFARVEANDGPQLLPEVERAIRGHLERNFGQPFRELRETFGDTFPNDKVIEVTNHLLQATGFAWRAVDVGGKRTGFFTNSAKELIECGRFTNALTWESFEKLMVHEVGVHAWRTRAGKNLGAALLEQELPGVIDFEEGLGILFERVWGGIASAGVGRQHYRYLIGTYAAGPLDGMTHSIDETFQFITKLKAVELVSNSMTQGKTIEPDATLRRARQLMFEHTFRAFRGMPEGVLMPKDLSYFAAEAGLIPFCNAYQDMAELIDDLLIAKIDSRSALQLNYARAMRESSVWLIK